ncbi:hypothetical protein [Thermococcus sp. AM4]|uniref:hypothetical protein n=1 Tax=Thermococcus sp. (strain AM4) TaxID=246969 RepID=UPI0001870DD4|nr:hypothetical protein [Thermococcus sp. AM4]
MTSKNYIGISVLIFSIILLGIRVDLKLSLFTATSVVALFFGWCYFRYRTTPEGEVFWKLGKLFLGFVSSFFILDWYIWGFKDSLYALYAFLWFAGPAMLVGHIAPKINMICQNPDMNKKRVESTAKYIKLFVVIIAAITFIGSVHFGGSWVLGLLVSTGILWGCYCTFREMEGLGEQKYRGSCSR